MKYWIDFRDFVCGGKDLWVSARSFNGLVKLDFDNYKTVYVAGFKNPTQNVELHGSVIDTEDRIYFIPSLEGTLDIYDKRSGSVSSIRIYPQDMAWHCLSAYLVESKIILLPFQTQDIICYDIETGEITTISNWEDDIGMKFKAEGYFISGSGTVRGERLYAVSQRNEGVMELNITNMAITWHHLSDCHIAFSTMADDGKYLWMAANNDTVFVSWNIDNDEKRYFRDFPDNYRFDKERGIPFCYMVDCEDRILAASVRANMSLWIEKETGKITESKLLNQENIIRFDVNDIEEYRLAKKLNEDTILLVSCRDKAIVKYNWKQNLIERNLIEITADIRTGILRTTIDNSKEPNISFTVVEDIFKLKDFLNYIILESDKQDMTPIIGIEDNMQELNIGNKIFANIKDGLLK